jgi:glutamine synthetase
MKNNRNFALSNPIEKITGKTKYEWTAQDLLKVIEERNIEKITFHYTGWDGKIKDLRIPVTNQEHAEHILMDGERVDGSSLFKGVVDTGRSDLYVVPNFRSAFLNPFDQTSLDFVCRFFDKDGNLAAFAPDNILLKAAGNLEKKFGLRLYALPELEFYIIQESKSDNYKLMPQSGYHSSSPFVKSADILDEIVRAISTTTGFIKYAHYEVGAIEKIKSEFPQFNGKNAEQVEVEFLLTPVEEAADIAVVSMWIIRNIAFRHNAIATFYPKLEVGHAGNGLHFHLALYKNGKNIMTDAEEKLSAEAKTLIGGLTKFAPSLTAFGNMVSGSYLRLVPNQEAPTKVCWSEMNRSAMIRVPLAWTNVGKLSNKINPECDEECEDKMSRQTVEIRTPDGSANIHLLLAGITKSADWAFGNLAAALDLTEKHYVQGNIHGNPEYSDLPEIATSCFRSAEDLIQEKELYCCDGLFPEYVIESVAKMLKSENDIDLNKFIAGLPEEERITTLRRVIHKAIISKNI